MEYDLIYYSEPPFQKGDIVLFYGKACTVQNIKCCRHKGTPYWSLKLKEKGSFIVHFDVDAKFVQSIGK